MNSRERDALDRYITGNYGEDQFPDDTDERADDYGPDIETDHDLHGGAAGSFRAEGCTLCPPRCEATTKPDMIGSVVSCELDHDDGPRVHHEGRDSHGNRVTWMTGPYDAAPTPTTHRVGTRSMLQEQADRATMHGPNRW